MEREEMKEFIRESVYKFYEETKDIAETVLKIDQEIEERLITEFIEERSIGHIIPPPEKPDELEPYIEARKKEYMIEALKELIKILEAE